MCWDGLWVNLSQWEASSRSVGAAVGSAELMASLLWPGRCWGAAGQDLCAWDKNVCPVSEQQQLRASCPAGFELPDEPGAGSSPLWLRMHVGTGCG